MLAATRGQEASLSLRAREGASPRTQAQPWTELAGAPLTQAHCLPGEPGAWRLPWRRPVDPALGSLKGRMGMCTRSGFPRPSGSPRPGKSQGGSWPSARTHTRPLRSPGNRQWRELAELQSAAETLLGAWGLHASPRLLNAHSRCYSAGSQPGFPQGAGARPLPCGQGQLGLGGGRVSHAGVHTQCPPLLHCN